MTACELLNGLSAAAARTEFTRCCGSEECVPDARLCPALTKPRFAAKLASARPFGSPAELHEAALRVWWHETPVAGWLQAFAAHPRIGDGSALRARFAATAGWSEGEQQAAMDSASEGVLAQLAAWNERYEAKFGHTFILCATGRPAAEVLAALQARFPSSPHAELAAGAAEQAKITALRLDKLLASLPADASRAAAERRAATISEHVTPPRPPITTHVLDTALGRPAAGVALLLERREGGEWQAVGRGETDADGRCATLQAAGAAAAAGEYRLSFATGAYLGEPLLSAFYPSVSVAFRVTAAQADQGQHFHVPLLLSPYGYSTYRGS